MLKTNIEIPLDASRDLTMTPLTLRFKDEVVERQFGQSYVAQALPLTRIYMLIGLGAYLLYSVLDVLVLSEDLGRVLMVRLGISTILAGLIFASFVKRSYRAVQLILSLCVLFSGGGIIFMTGIMDPPFSFLYYAGLILIIIYSSNLLIFRFVFSTSLSIFLFALYLLTATVLNPIPAQFVITNTFFLFVTVAWTIWTSYWQEIYVRREFLQRHLLRQEIKRSARLLKSAEAGNRAKSEFLAVISHELRTPLNAIIGFSEIMQQKLFGSIGSEKYEDYVDDIVYSGRHLLGIINDILDLSKAESGKLEVYEDDVDLSYVVQQVLRMFRDSAAKEGVRLSSKMPAKPMLIWADERLLQQVIINLVSNAVKFTQKGGEVNVTVEDLGAEGCGVYICDTGIGIENESIQMIVEPFVQVETALSRENGGAGLGLPLVKKIVELHDGSLSIESEIGVGTQVSAKFPLWRLEKARENAAPMSPEIVVSEEA